MCTLCFIYARTIIHSSVSCNAASMRMRSHGSGLHGEHTAMTRSTRSARCINGRQRSVARDVRSRRVQKRGRRRQCISAHDRLTRHAPASLYPPRHLPPSSKSTRNYCYRTEMEQITSQLAPRASAKPSAGGAGGDPAGSVTKR